MSKGALIFPKSLLKMSKPRLLATELLKRRLEEKSPHKRQLIRNHADLHFIGGDQQGFSPSLVVTSEGNSYLFNCGEGWQRYCYANKLRISGIENVFVTNKIWERVSGIYGLSLTLQDVGAPALCVHSSEGIGDFFSAAKPFLQFNTGMVCSTRDNIHDPYCDSGIQVTPVVLDSEVSSCLGEARGEELQLDEEQLQKTKKTKVNPKLLAYICSFPDLPGSLDPKKCAELKVPIGPLLSVLKSGVDVTLEDGRIIKTSQVCAPKNLGLNFMVIDCPSVDHINYVINNSRLNSSQKFRSINQENQIDIVVHFSPEIVTNDPKYREWMMGFAETCKHFLLSHSENKKINFIDCYRLQYLLHKIDKNIFPSLNLPTDLAEEAEEHIKRNLAQDVKGPLDDPGDEFTRDVLKGDFKSLERVYRVSSLDKIVIRPKQFIESVEDTVSLDVIFKQNEQDELFKEELNNLAKLQQTLPQPKDYEPEVVFLGTSSAMSSKYRSTSCILLNLHQPKKFSIILDCGEDSYGQLYRFYGPERASEILKQLKLIYVSHHHADHHLGLIQLLRHRKQLTDEPILLLLPSAVEEVLNYYNANFEDLRDSYEIFSTFKDRRGSAFDNSSPKTSDKFEKIYKEFDHILYSINLVKVDHCRDSYAIIMRFEIGQPDMETFTLCYSGDARPSREFARYGKGCDLLIHEATFDHRSEKDALLKKHSTSTEAIRIAKEMEAKFTILTHFSLRIPKIPYFTEDFNEKIGFAFDNMSLRCPSHFCRLPILKPILSQAFKKSISEMDMKYYKQLVKEKCIEDLIKS